MKNLGDITKISGYNAPIVDVVIGGSPCQDLSVAGKRAGLAGERSGLYMEQIRIIKEMREYDKTGGRTGQFIRPRYMVWENVPGAFSSNHGKDFAAVLEEAVRIVEPEVPHVPVPEKGWPTSGCLMGDEWSVAWRVLDAQFWGVPQRRRRIALVADFGGHTAPEILFVRESVSGDSEPGGTEGKGFAGDAENGVGAAVSFVNRGHYRIDGVSETLRSECHQDIPCVCAGFKLGNSEKARSIGWEEEKSPTLNAENGGNKPSICIQGNCIDRADTSGCNGKGWRDDDVSFTLNTIDRPAVYAIENHPAGSRVKISYNGVVQTRLSRMGTGGGNVPMCIGKDGDAAYTISSAHEHAVCIGNGQADIASHITEDVAQTLNCMHDAQAVFCQDVAHTLKAKANLDFREDSETYLAHSEKVRRLTPLECERLQGFPSRKEIDIREMTKDEYIAWNLQCGNIVADPESGKVFTTRGPDGVRLSKPKELLGSTVNGYKVVSIRNGTTKLQCRIHRIVWISVNGVVPNGYCIDHINSDKQDNRLSNLQLLTPIENSHKAKEDGLYKTGEDNKATKISPELYDEIAYLYATDDFTIRELAEVYGISKSRISQIIKETGWTDIGDWVDSKGKKRQTTDSARYKALGNSIALPPWKWVLKRLCAQYERDATMASLFDGIGGFPLIWEQLNGKGSCLWASEIEEFPIAVTRQRFREEQ